MNRNPILPGKFTGRYLGLARSYPQDREHIAYITGDHGAEFRAWQTSDSMEQVLGNIPVLSHYGAITAATSNKILRSSWTMGSIKLTKTFEIPPSATVRPAPRSKPTIRYILTINTLPLYKLEAFLDDGTPDIRLREDNAFGAGESFTMDLTVINLNSPDPFDMIPPTAQRVAEEKAAEREAKSAQAKVEAKAKKAAQKEARRLAAEEARRETIDLTQETGPDPAATATFTSDHLAQLNAMRGAMPPPAPPPAPAQPGKRKRSSTDTKGRKPRGSPRKSPQKVLLPDSEVRKQSKLTGTGGLLNTAPPPPSTIPSFPPYNVTFLPAPQTFTPPSTPQLVDQVLDMLSPASSPTPASLSQTSAYDYTVPVVPSLSQTTIVPDMEPGPHSSSQEAALSETQDPLLQQSQNELEPLQVVLLDQETDALPDHPEGGDPEGGDGETDTGTQQ